MKNKEAAKQQKKGKWIHVERRGPQFDVEGILTWSDVYKCSECGFIYTVIENVGHHDFCPNCGKDMRGEQELKNKEAVKWLTNLIADIGKTEHGSLWHYEQPLSEIKAMLESDESERKKGKWIRITSGAIQEEYICSVCGRHINENTIDELMPIRYPFCHCGADMRGEQDDTD